MSDSRYILEARRLLSTATLEDADIENVRLLLGQMIAEILADPRPRCGTPVPKADYIDDTRMLLLEEIDEQA